MTRTDVSLVLYKGQHTSWSYILVICHLMKTEYDWLVFNILSYLDIYFFLFNSRYTQVCILCTLHVVSVLSVLSCWKDNLSLLGDGNSSLWQTIIVCNYHITFLSKCDIRVIPTGRETRNC